jgi:L,D-transpeptidase ErfK/SrfK
MAPTNLMASVCRQSWLCTAYPEDIKVLFKKAAVGMPVRIVHQPYKTAWVPDMLYLKRINHKKYKNKAK